MPMSIVPTAAYLSVSFCSKNANEIMLRSNSRTP